MVEHINFFLLPAIKMETIHKGTTINIDSSELASHWKDFTLS